MDGGAQARLRAALAASAIVLVLVGGAPPVAGAAGVLRPGQPTRAPVSITYSGLLKAFARHAIRNATLDESAQIATVVFRDGHRATAMYPRSDSTLPMRMAEDGVDVTIMHGSSTGIWFAPLLLASLLLPTAVWLGLRHRSEHPTDAMANAREAANVGLRADVELSRAPATRFTDVAGCDEAVDELAEIVAFLRTPEKFARVNARMPAGLLLTGPPGTGKTMLARALAGEAGVRFFTVSGSEFVEKYVGVGASRVRELFMRATANAPSVIFIDEIDAIGTTRGQPDGNGERDQTLNELLVRMDGFAVSNRIVVVAATNRPEVLDPALLRPGRFSRQISVGLPSAAGRRAILAVHSASKPLAPGVDLDGVAATTGGFSGAQLAELLNEAAIMAARDDRRAIDRKDIQEGLRRVIAGPKRKSAPIAEGELEKIAYHEAGHVVCAELCEHHEKAQHVTVDPRGNAMGFALFADRDRALHDEQHLREAMVAALGGRAAEQLVFGRVSTGAKNDLEKVNAIARAAVTEYGMSTHIGQFAGDERRFSNETRALIDREVERLIAAAYREALGLLETHRHELDILAGRLLEARELERIDIVTALEGA